MAKDMYKIIVYWRWNEGECYADMFWCVRWPKVESIDELACKLLELDEKHEQDNIFYAMASYKEVQTKTMKMKDGRGFTYVVGRTQDNAAFVKSLWMDLDVGKDKGYAEITSKTGQFHDPGIA